MAELNFLGILLKQLAAGADAIMMGSIFAGTDESPGKKFKIKGKILFYNIEEWDQLVQCHQDLQIGIFKKI